MSAGPDRTVRLAGVRRMIADRMLASLRDSAQLSYHADADATALVAAREAWRAAGLKAGYEDLVIAVLAKVLGSHPLLNGKVEGNEAKLSAAVHVGVAIALPGSLVAPALFDAQARTIPEINAARLDLVERARVAKLTVPEMTGGTITLSNLGITRVRHFTPIVNLPQLAVVGLGQIAARPWVDAQGQLCVRQVIGLSLTTDHRFIDGEPSGAFLTDLCNALEQGPPLPPP